jgi:hypothetical protein
LDRINALLKNNHVRAILLSAFLIVAMSWLRVYVAGTIKVDGHGLAGLPVYVVFFTFIASLGVYSVSLYKLWKDNTLTSPEVRLVSYILAVLFSLMLPMLSNDIFSLLTYGDSANRGIDVYIDTHSFMVSPYFEFVSNLWKTAPCVYGPIPLSTSRIATGIGAGHLLLSLAVYKALALFWAVIFIEVMTRVGTLLGTPSRSLLFILLNPLFLIQGLAQLHCDAIAITLTGCMLYFFLDKKWYWAFLFAGLSIATKISFVLMLPFLVVGLFIQKDSWGSFFSRAFAGVAITIITVAALYLPYYTSPQTFQTPFKFVFEQDPAKSIPEVIGDVIYFAPAVLSGKEDQELHNNLHVKPGISPRQLEAWLLVKKVCQLFALIMSAWVFFRFWMGRRDMRQWIKVFTRLMLLFLLFYSHVFYAWYLLMMLPFLWYEDDLRFMQWLFVLTCFSNIHDVLCAVQRGTPVYFLVLPLTFIGILIFAWRFRSVFFRSVSETATS